MDIYGLREYFLLRKNPIEDHIFSYLNYKELCVIKTINKFFSDKIINVNVNDIETEIKNSKIWSINFPNAIGVRITDDWKNDDFKLLKKIKRLNMNGCRRISDEAFKYLERIHTLHMRGWWITA